LALARRRAHRWPEHLPLAAARTEEVRAHLREQLREDGRRAIETIARRYAETEGRGAIEAVIRHQLGTPGGAVADDLVRSVAREVVPTIAERLIREEIARLRRDVRPG